MYQNFFYEDFHTFQYKNQFNDDLDKMSAINGIFLRNSQELDSEIIKKMNDSLTHRGPNGSRTWHKGSVGLGHQMLFTTPESVNENLPFFDENSGLTITADARIDNRKELCEKLNIEDSTDISDSYFILKAYEKWQDKCPEKLLGDFAFAIWDEQKQELFCARDHMGVKPFYYYFSDDVFLFSTEIKALFSVGKVPKIVNDTKIADYLISSFEDREMTFYEDILRLPAASMLYVGLDKHSLKSYWSLDPSHKLYLDSDEDYAEAFRRLFKEAVSCRLRSAFTVGSELSGGLDSSSVTCMAHDLLSNENTLQTFSVIFERFPDSSEQHFMEIITESYGIDSHYIYGDKINPFEVLENSLWPTNGPLSAHSMYVFWHLYKKAQKNDVRILLSGFEGDATVGRGYGLYCELALKMKWKTVIEEVFAKSKLIDISPYEILFSELILPLIPKSIKNMFLFLLNKDISYEWATRKFIQNDFAKKINLSKHYQILKDKSIYEKYGVDKNHLLILNSGFFQNALEEFDLIGSNFSMEFRYPFMDRRLIEFCLSLPSEQQLNGGWDRIIMRRAMIDVIPPEIQWRRDKKFFTSNFNYGILKFGDEKIDSLSSANNQLKEYVEIEKLKRLFHELKSDSRLKKVGHDPYAIWKILSLESWLNKV